MKVPRGGVLFLTNLTPHCSRENSADVVRWSLDLRTTVALGSTHQRLTIDGSQVRTLPGQAPLVFRGGLLALDSNIGTFSRDRFSVVPEVGPLVT